MAAILIGTIVYFVLYLGSAYLIQNYVTKDVEDAKLKSEYRK